MKIIAAATAAKQAHIAQLERIVHGHLRALQQLLDIRDKCHLQDRALADAFEAVRAMLKAPEPR